MRDALCRWCTVAYVTLIGLMLLVGCGEGMEEGTGGGSGPPPLEDQTLQGNVRGESWTFTAGTASVSNDRITLELYAGPDDACTFDPLGYDNWRVITRVPNQETRTELKLSNNSEERQTVTIGREGDNITITSGVIEITSIGSGTVEGGLVADGEESLLNGEFQATRCDNQ